MIDFRPLSSLPRSSRACACVRGGVMWCVVSSLSLPDLRTPTRHRGRVQFARAAILFRGWTAVCARPAHTRAPHSRHVCHRRRRRRRRNLPTIHTRKGCPPRARTLSAAHNHSTLYRPPPFFAIADTTDPFAVQIWLLIFNHKSVPRPRAYIYAPVNILLYFHLRRVCNYTYTYTHIPNVNAIRAFAVTEFTATAGKYPYIYNWYIRNG